MLERGDKFLIPQTEKSDPSQEASTPELNLIRLLPSFKSVALAEAVNVGFMAGRNQSL